MTTGESVGPDRKECVSCRSMIPKEAQACPNCGQVQPTKDDMLRPMGGEFAAPVRRPRVPPAEPERPPGTVSTPRGGGPARAREEEAARPQRSDSAAEFVRELWKVDRWFAIVLGIIVVQGVIALLTGSVVGAVISAVVVWGLLAYNYWVYIVVVIVYGFGLFGGVMGLIVGQGWSLVNLMQLAITAVVFGVLIDRHSHYV